MDVTHLKDFGWTFKITDNGHTHCFNPDGEQRCGSKSRNTGKPCNSHILYENGRCNNHAKGAASKRAENHPATKHGKHSKYMDSMPKRLREMYSGMLENGEILDLTENVALLDVFIHENLDQLEQGGLGKLWTDISNVYNDAETDLRQSQSGKNKDAFQRFLRAFFVMGSLIQRGNADYLARQEILQITDKRRQLVKTISDIEYKGENAITLAQFMLLLNMLEDLFYRVNRIEDATERKQAYAEGIQRIYAGSEN